LRNNIKNLIIVNISCKGKQIFFQLVDNTGNVLYINSRLGLEGKWSLKEGNHTRFCLYLYRYLTNIKGITKIENVILYYDDSINYGGIDILSEQQYQRKIKEIGPDLLSENINYNIWYNIIKNGRLKQKQICNFLMDQKKFSGIGNYLKSEILYRSKIRPDRVLSSISDDEINTLYNVTLQTIKEAYLAGGLTIKSFWSPDGQRGMFPVHVYKKEIDPLGNSIVAEKFKDGRTSYWVPKIQL